MSSDDQVRALPKAEGGGFRITAGDAGKRKPQTTALMFVLLAFWGVDGRRVLCRRQRPCRVCCEVRCLTGKVVSTVRPGTEAQPLVRCTGAHAALANAPQRTLFVSDFFSSPGKTGRVDENQLFRFHRYTVAQACPPSFFQNTKGDLNPRRDAWQT